MSYKTTALSLMIATGFGGFAQAQTTAPTLSTDAQAVLTLAEELYPSLFTKGSAVQQLDGYVYRFYQVSGTYVGFKDGKVFLLGGPFGGSVTDMGSISGVITLLEKTKAAQNHSGDLVLANRSGVIEGAGLFVDTGSGLLAFWSEVRDLKVTPINYNGTQAGAAVGVIPADEKIGWQNGVTDFVTLADGSGYLLALNSANGIQGGQNSLRFLKVDKTGTASGQLNEIIKSPELQGTLQVAQLNDGGFVFVWEQASIGTTGPDFFIGARVYGADSAPRTDVLKLIDRTGDVTFAGVQSTTDGGFVVAYTDRSKISSGDIQMQFFDNSAKAKGNVVEGIDQGKAVAFAKLTNGNFAIGEVTKVGLGGTGSSSTISVHIVNSAGLSVVKEVVIDKIAPLSSFGGDQHYPPNLKAMSDGGFMVGFTRSRRGGTDPRNDTGTLEDVFARRVDSKGQLQGSEIAVNASLAGKQFGGGMTLLADGRLLFSWGHTGVPVMENDSMFSIVRLK